MSGYWGERRCVCVCVCVRVDGYGRSVVGCQGFGVSVDGCLCVCVGLCPRVSPLLLWVRYSSVGTRGSEKKVATLNIFPLWVHSPQASIPC